MKRATKITIEIELENATFFPQPEPELVRILKELTNKLRHGRVNDLGRIADDNGNTVGCVTCDR